MQLPLRNNTLDALLPLPQEEQPGRAAESTPQGRCPVQRGGQPALVSELAQQDPVDVGDETAASGGDLQGMVPGRILHREGRSSLELLGVVARNLPVAGDPFAPEPVVPPSRTTPGACTIQVRPLNAGQGETLKLQFRETRKQECR
jgi:hypothetical protein